MCGAMQRGRSSIARSAASAMTSTQIRARALASGRSPLRRLDVEQLALGSIRHSRPATRSVASARRADRPGSGQRHAPATRSRAGNGAPRSDPAIAAAAASRAASPCGYELRRDVIPDAPARPGRLVDRQQFCATLDRSRTAVTTSRRLRRRRADSGAFRGSSAIRRGDGARRCLARWHVQRQRPFETARDRESWRRGAYPSLRRGRPLARYASGHASLPAGRRAHRRRRPERLRGPERQPQRPAAAPTSIPVINRERRWPRRRRPRRLHPGLASRAHAALREGRRDLARPLHRGHLGRGLPPGPRGAGRAPGSCTRAPTARTATPASRCATRPPARPIPTELDRAPARAGVDATSSSRAWRPTTA